MTIEEWKNENKFKHNKFISCGICPHCKYDGDLNILYCKKMYEETGSSSIINCKVYFENTYCKKVIEE